jgi:hypothetical protein
MHFLLISLLAILAGTLLLIKSKKEALGKFFNFISWFFIVVGFALFLCFIGGSIFRMAHGGRPGRPAFRHEMMMRGGPHGMMMMKGVCCPEGKVKGCCEGGMVRGKGPGGGMAKGCCESKSGCMMNDSTMKNCPMHMAGDSVKMVCPKAESMEKKE